jgi:hypothetical protein
MNMYSEALLRAVQDPLTPGNLRERRYLQAFIAYLQQDERSLPGGDFSEEVRNFLVARERVAPDVLITYSAGDIGERS